MDIRIAPETGGKEEGRREGRESRASITELKSGALQNSLLALPVPECSFAGGRQKQNSSTDNHGGLLVVEKPPPLGSG